MKNKCIHRLKYKTSINSKFEIRRNDDEDVISQVTTSKKLPIFDHVSNYYYYPHHAP